LPVHSTPLLARLYKKFIFIKYN